MAAHMGWFVLVALFFSAGAIRAKLVAARVWIDRAFGVSLAAATVSR